VASLGDSENATKQNYGALPVNEGEPARHQGETAMSDLPKHVHFHEEGPREGFQIEPVIYPLADRVALWKRWRKPASPPFR
jgi:hypothetical protein